MQNPCISYSIDKEDNLTSVSDNWQLFAEQNQAAYLTPEVVLNSPLKKFITDMRVRHLYMMLTQRVRDTQILIEFHFRCDSPDKRRFMEMKLYPLPNDAVGFESCILKEEPRDPVKLLDTGNKKNNSFLKICSWCKKVNVNKLGWVEVEEAVSHLDLFGSKTLPQLTHGICPECLKDFTAKITAK